MRDADNKTLDGIGPLPGREVVILVADDEPMLRSVLHEFLDTLPGFKVAEASDGLEALDYIRANDVDFLLSDVSMPRMGLDELLAIVTREFPSVAVIGSSGFSDFEDAKRLLQAGAQDFLPKPLNLSDLEQTLNFILTRNDILSRASRAFGTGELDPDNGSRQAFEEVFRGLANVSGARGTLMHHARRTSELAERVFGDEPRRDLAELRLAALFHEIGSTSRYLTTIAEPRGLLPQELAYVRAQFCVGARLLEQALPERKASLIVGDHANWVSAGDSSETENEGSAALGRRLGVLNAVDALAHARADRKSLSKDAARKTLDRFLKQTHAEALARVLDRWSVVEDFYEESWREDEA